MIDRAMVQNHLAEAERHVAEGEQRVARQRGLVSQLEAEGHSALAKEARSLLAQFDEMLAMYIADRERIRKELTEGWPTR